MRFTARLAIAAAIGLSGAAVAKGQAQAQPEDWVEVIRHPAGPIWIDRNSVRRDGNFVIVMSRSDFDPPQPDGTRAFRARFRYDCVNRTSDLLWLQQLGSDGRIMLSGDIEPGDREVEPIPANSPNAAIVAQLCN